MSNSSEKLAIIGLGNPLRKDDGVGIIALNRLKLCLKRPDIDYFDFGTGSFDILFKINEYKAILIIDAVNAGMEPGDHKIFPLEAVESEIITDMGSTHGFGLKQLRMLCSSFGSSGKVFVAGIQIVDVSEGNGTSDLVNKKLDSAIDNISLYINKYLSS
ncbi:MAG: hydrogenase maturation protease [Candidatus Saganbacteria bacterium]|nr:hydrogenase maturation protease [Candidatus Saganbacteria bacterium]